jgi:phage pi2 protein 07
MLLIEKTQYRGLFFHSITIWLNSDTFHTDIACIDRVYDLCCASMMNVEIIIRNEPIIYFNS